MIAQLIKGTPKQRLRATFYAGAILAFCLLIINYSIFLNKAHAEQTAMIRVHLTNLALQDRIQIGIYGNYSIDGKISFQRGSEMTIAISDDALVLYYEGMAYRTGQPLTLLRHQANAQEENGLRLQQGFNLYSGDLSLSVQSGQLSAILNIPVEEYLMGVVPYEMSDDFPLEALKAQAIAARTYTLNHLKPLESFDLVDNTNDQVYRGFDSSKINAVRAVQDTNGICCVYQDSLAQCYYTASNGGYTESAFNAWGREVIPYLQVQKDPYDLENPLSEVRTAEIPKQISEDGSNLNQELYHYLFQAVRARFETMGLNTDSENIRIQKITGIVPHTTKFGGEEGVMSLLRFELEVAGREPVKPNKDVEIFLEKPNNPVVSEPDILQWSEMMTLKNSILIDCPVFPDIERMLHLSINANPNEIIHIKDGDSSIIISFARYGHGVGLSQRGAEWMAKTYGWKYEQILRFYYPGTTLKQYKTAATLPLPMKADFLSTPGPIPTPTPRPTLMPQNAVPKQNERLVIVTGVTPNSSLNLRAMPNLTSEVLMRLFYGQELLVLERLQDGWLLVKTDVVQGYVKEEFVSAKPQ